MSERFDYTKTSPGGVKAFGSVYGYIMQSGLDEVLVDLVYLRVSQINGCAYCLDMHTRDLIKKGVKIEKLALVQVWQEAGNLFSDRERAALAWAETVTRVAQTGVPDVEFEAASHIFDEKELADLTMAISLMNAYNRLAISFRRTPEAVLAEACHKQIKIGLAQLRLSPFLGLVHGAVSADSAHVGEESRRGARGVGRVVQASAFQVEQTRVLTPRSIYHGEHADDERSAATSV